jgi:hypothetical protein
LPQLQLRRLKYEYPNGDTKDRSPIIYFNPERLQALFPLGRLFGYARH